MANSLFLTASGLKQPVASDLSNGTTGTGFVVLASAPSLSGTVAIGVAGAGHLAITGDNLNDIVITNGEPTIQLVSNAVGGKTWLLFSGGGAHGPTGKFSIYDVTSAVPRLSLAAASSVTGHVLRSDGVQFTDAALAMGDISDYVASGTWTPTLQGSTTPGVQTYGTQVGRYTKIGERLFCDFTITLTAFDAATAGFMQIGGLPFAVNAIPANLVSSTAGGYGGVNQGAGFPVIYYSPNPGASTASIEKVGPNVNQAALVPADITATSTFRGTIIYRT